MTLFSAAMTASSKDKSISPAPSSGIGILNFSGLLEKEKYLFHFSISQRKIQTSGAFSIIFWLSQIAASCFFFSLSSTSNIEYISIFPALGARRVMAFSLSTVSFSTSLLSKSLIVLRLQINDSVSSLISTPFLIKQWMERRRQPSLF